MVAARLGNKANRSRFVDAFWYHTPDEDDPYRWLGLQSVLKAYEQTPPERTWSEAGADFRATETRVATLRGERSAAYHAVQERAELDREVARLSAAVPAADARIEAARARREAAVRGERARMAEAERIAQEQQRAAEQAARRRRDDAEQVVNQRRAEVERIVTGRQVDAERQVRSWEAERERRWQVRNAHQRR